MLCGLVRHARANGLSVFGARDIVGKSGIVDQLLVAGQLGPAFEHGVAHGLHDHPAIVCAKHVVRCGGKAAIAETGPIGRGNRLLDQRVVGDRQAGQQQRRIDRLSGP